LNVPDTPALCVVVADGVGEALAIAFVVLALSEVVFEEDFFEALVVGAVRVGVLLAGA
jgi:hypothetical protein